MRFHTLNIQNFMSIGQVNMSLADKGLVLVLGENQDSQAADSNGSAKTACLDAICWCLWGVTTRGLSADDVVHRLVGSNCEVTVTGEVRGSHYRITRYRKSKTNAKANDLRIFVDDKELTGATMADTQTVVTKFVGMDYATFAAMMPGSGFKAAELTDKEVKTLLESILQTEHFASAHLVAKDQANAIQLELSSVTAEIAAKNEEIAKVESTLSKLKDAKDSFEVRKASEVAAVQFELSKHRSKYADALALCESAKHLPERLQDLSVQYTGLKVALDTLVKRREEHAKALSEVRVAMTEKVVPLNSEIAQLQKAVTVAKSLGDSCDKCLQPVPVEFKDSIISDRTERIKTLEADVLTATQAAKAESEAIQALQNVLATEKTTTESAIDAVYSEMESLKNRIHEADVAAATSKTLADLIKSVDGTLAMTQAKTFAYDSQMIDLRAKAESTASEVSKLMTKEALLSSNLEMANFWVKAYSPAGIRSYVLEQVVPWLNQRATFYADILTSGEMQVMFSTTSTTKKGDDKQYFTIDMTMRNGADSYQGCSAGEKARADLVVALTLGDLAAARSQHGLSFRFIDEAFEKMDGTGVDAVVRLLKAQESEYKSVFVVTHKRDLQDHFDKSITMVKSNGRTSLKEQS